MLIWQREELGIFNFLKTSYMLANITISSDLFVILGNLELLRVSHCSQFSHLVSIESVARQTCYPQNIRVSNASHPSLSNEVNM